MKKLAKVVFIYSIVAITANLIALGLFNPSPQNLISSVLLFPILLYLWLLMTHPEAVSAGRWPLRLLLVIFLLSLSSVYALYLANIGNIRSKVEAKNTDPSKITALESEIAKLRAEKKDNQKLSDELTSIKEKLAELDSNENSTLAVSSQSSDLADLLMENDKTDALLGNVTIKNNLTKSVDVLEVANFSAKPVGKITYGNNYPYYETDGNWYKIMIDNSVFGWVHDRDVKKID